MTTARLDSTERRRAIVEVALPLFAKKGFAATTVRAIATAAGVSEALIFKHFPSKAALYEAILREACDNDEELIALLARPPSTETLVEFVRGITSYFLFEVPVEEAAIARQRLYLISLLDDGEYARVARTWMRETVLPIFAASLAAAEAAGDLVPSPVTADQRLCYAEHLCSSLASHCLARRPAADAACDDGTIARQVVWFLLRGIGMTDAALARHAAEPWTPYPVVPSFREPGPAPEGDVP